MPPKLIALGVIAIVLSIMMMIIAPPQDTTHHSADAGRLCQVRTERVGIRTQGTGTRTTVFEFEDSHAAVCLPLAKRALHYSS